MESASSTKSSSRIRILPAPGCRWRQPSSCASSYFGSSSVELLMNSLQPLPQMEDRVALAREQRIDAQPALPRQLLKTAALHLMRHENPTLLFRQLIERGGQLFYQHTARVGRFRPAVGRWQQIFEARRPAFVIDYRNVRERLRLLLAKPVDNAIARHAIQP